MNAKPDHELPDLKSLDVDSDTFLSLAYCERMGFLRIPHVAQSKEQGKAWRVTIEKV